MTGGPEARGRRRASPGVLGFGPLETNLATDPGRAKWQRMQGGAGHRAPHSDMALVVTV